MRRTNRVLPEPRARGSGARGSGGSGGGSGGRVNLADDEVVTTAPQSNRRRTAAGSMPRTARPPVPTASQEAASDAGPDADGQSEGGGGDGSGTGVVRQWMAELASGARPVPAQGGGTVRAPREREVAILTGMFPDVEREVLLGVLQRR